MAGTILNNQSLDSSINLRVVSPYLTLNDPKKPKPLSGGFVYFGAPDRDPTDPAYQKRVYVVQEDGSVVPVEQPIELDQGGTASHNESPVILAVDGDYSMLATDANGAQKYYAPYVNNLTSAAIGGKLPTSEVYTLSDAEETITFTSVDVQICAFFAVGPEIDDTILIRDRDYAISNGSTGDITLLRTYDAGTVIQAKQYLPGDAANQSVNGNANMYTFDTMADAIASNMQVGNYCEIADDSEGDDKGGDFYKVVEGYTGAADDVNYIDMDNGNQLWLKPRRYKFKTFNETSEDIESVSGVLTIDCSTSTVKKITLDENVTSIAFVNVNGDPDTSSSVTLLVRQDETGGRTITFNDILFSGGVAPTVTSTANARDMYVFNTPNGGITWYGFAAGQGFA